MERLTAAEIAEKAGGKVIFGDPGKTACGAEIDSRKVGEGYLFCALKGETTDGHRFLIKAAEAGASILMVSDPDAPELKELMTRPGAPAVVLVDETLLGLQTLSERYLEERPMLKVAVTGSVGKTSTRDLLHAALSSGLVTGKNKANYNSSTGLPLTLLDLTGDMQAAVLEMGMESAGEIRRLAEIAKPDMAVITNIGISHIERLGSRENIRLAKMEVAERFGPEYTLIVNGDDDMLGALDGRELPYRLIKVVTGVSGETAESGNVYHISDIVDKGVGGVEFRFEGFPVRLPVPGAHNAMNASLALAAACAAGLDLAGAIEGIEKAELTGGRLKVIDSGGMTLIDDSYNAAPDSMISALRTLCNSEGRRRIAVLAGMNELGSESREEHRRVGREAAEMPLDLLITIGDKGKDIAIGAEADYGCEETERRLAVECFDTKEEVMERAAELFRPADTVHFKASRSFALEELIKELVNKGMGLWA